MPMLAMPQYEETTPTGEHHAFFFKEAGRPPLHLEMYCGEWAAQELGTFEEAKPGLNRMKTPGGTSYVLITEDPAMSQRTALEIALATLHQHHVVSTLTYTTTERWKDFAGHPEADLFIRLNAEVEELPNLSEEERESRTMTFGEMCAELSVTPMTEEEITAYRKAEEKERRQAIARGRERFRAAREAGEIESLH